jgi:hypothetical protein
VSEQFATLAAALRDRADAARAEAAFAVARARVWDLAAEVAAEGGVVARQLLRVLAGGTALPSDPGSLLARALGLFDTRHEAAAWLGPLPETGTDYAAVFRVAAARAAGSAQRSGGP